MTGRQRIQAAFSAAGAREIAVVTCYEHLYIRDHWDEFTSLPWWYLYAPDVERQMAWRREVMPKIGHDWIEAPACLPVLQRRHLDIDARPDGVFLVDRRSGRERKLNRPRIGGWSGAGRVESLHPTRIAASRAEVDDWIAAQPAHSLSAGVADGSGDLAAQILREFGDLYPIHIVESPLWRLYYLWGFDGLMTTIASEPELVAYACGRSLQLSIAEAKRAAALGAAGIWIEECLTDMISPQAFAALNTPFVAGLVQAIHAAGMQAIYYYCGNPAGKWRHILGAGADALALEESKKGFVIDIEDVVREVQGRCALLGNLDAMDLLERGSDADLRAEIARQISAGRRNGGRFVMSVGSPVTPGTSVQRIRRYCDLAHACGKP